MAFSQEEARWSSPLSTPTTPAILLRSRSVLALATRGSLAGFWGKMSVSVGEHGHGLIDQECGIRAPGQLLAHMH